MSRKNSELVCSLRTTVQNFFRIYVNFCTLVLLHSLTSPDRKNHECVSIKNTFLYFITLWHLQRHPVSMVNFIWFTDENLFTVSALSNMGGMKSGVSQARNINILQAVCAGALSCWKVWKSNYATGMWMGSFWTFHVAAMVKLQQLVISEPDAMSQCMVATKLTAAVEISKLVVITRHHYITTSKYYFNNSQTLLKYRKLAFYSYTCQKFCVNLSSFNQVMNERNKKG